MNSWFAILLLLAQTEQAAEEKAPSAPPISGELPDALEVHQAIGVAAEQLERERAQLAEERRRLEMLRDEIRTALGTKPREDKSTPEETEERKKEKAVDRETRVRQVSRNLCNMTPEAAATALTQMSVPLAVEIFAVMDSKKAGKILNALRPEKAARLLEALANRSMPAKPAQEKPR